MMHVQTLQIAIVKIPMVVIIATVTRGGQMLEMLAKTLMSVWTKVLAQFIQYVLISLAPMTVIAMSVMKLLVTTRDYLNAFLVPKGSMLLIMEIIQRAQMSTNVTLAHVMMLFVLIQLDHMIVHVMKA